MLYTYVYTYMRKQSDVVRVGYYVCCIFTTISAG
jgi:hypothetical protein